MTTGAGADEDAGNVGFGRRGDDVRTGAAVGATAFITVGAVDVTTGATAGTTIGAGSETIGGTVGDGTEAGDDTEDSSAAFGPLVVLLVLSSCKNDQM